MLANGRRIGAHLPLGHGMVRAADRAAEIGVDAIQVFTDNPTAWRRRPTLPRELPAFRDRLAAADIAPLVVHAPYLVNLAAPEPDVLRPVRVGPRERAPRRRGVGRGGRQRPRRLAPRLGGGRRHRAGSPTASCRAARDGRRRRAGRHRSSSRTAPAPGSGSGRASRSSAAGRGGARRPTGVGRERFAYCLDAAHLWGAGYADRRRRRASTRWWRRSTPRSASDRLRMVHLNDSRSELGLAHRPPRAPGRGADRRRGARPAAHASGPRRTSCTILETPGMDEGYDGDQLDRARDLAAGRPLAALPPEAFETRSAKGRSAPPRRTTTSRGAARDRRRRDTPAAGIGPEPPRLARGRACSSRSSPSRRCSGSPASTSAARGTPTRAPTCSSCRASSTGARCRCWARGRRSGRSTTAPSTTTCSRRPRSSRGGPGRGHGRDRAVRARRGRSRCGGSPGSLAGPVAGLAAARARGRLPGRHRGLDVHLEPEPDPVRVGGRVRGGAVRDPVPPRPLVAVVRARRDGRDAVPRAGGRRRAAAPRRVAGRRPRAAAPGRAPRAGGRARASARSRSSRPATCRCSPSSSSTTSRRRGRSSPISAGAAAAPRRGALARIGIVGARSIAWPVSGLFTDRPLLATVAVIAACALAAIAVLAGRRDRPPRRGLARRVRRLGDRRARAVRAEPRRDHARAARTTTTTRSSTRSCSRCSVRGSPTSPGARRTRARLPRRVPCPAGRTARRRVGSASCLVVVSVVAWPPATSPDGGWRLADAAAARTIRWRPDDPPFALVGIPPFKNATRCASRSSTAVASPVASPRHAAPARHARRRLRPAVQRRRRRRVRWPRGGCAAGRRGAAGHRTFVDRFDAGSRRVISVYARQPLSLAVYASRLAGSIRRGGVPLALTTDVVRIFPSPKARFAVGRRLQGPDLRLARPGTYTSAGGSGARGRGTAGGSRRARAARRQPPGKCERRPLQTGVRCPRDPNVEGRSGRALEMFYGRPGVRVGGRAGGRWTP